MASHSTLQTSSSAFARVQPAALLKLPVSWWYAKRQEFVVRWLLKGATSLVAGSPAVLDQTVIVLDQTVIVLDRAVIVFDRTVIVLDRTVITICGVLSFPSAWRWVRPSLVTSHYETHQGTAPPNSLLSQW